MELVVRHIDRDHFYNVNQMVYRMVCRFVWMIVSIMVSRVILIMFCRMVGGKVLLNSL